MNDLALPNDLNKIELEIQHHKNIAGQSIWEIGRRLNHVKENDLAHGEFMNWLQDIQIEYTSAKRMMKVASELPNSSTLHHLGESALYLIATLPEEDREKEHTIENGETKPTDEMTVRELQDLKKTLKEKEEKIKEQQEVIDNHADAEPEVVEKIVEVEKEVQHPHVEGLRSDNKQLSNALKKAQSEAKSAVERNEFIEKEYNDLLNQRTEVDKKSGQLDQIDEAIKNAKSEFDESQKLVADTREILKILKQCNELILTVGGLVYMEIAETVNNNKLISREFDQLIFNMQRLTNDLHNMRNEQIIEGEIIND